MNKLLCLLLLSFTALSAAVERIDLGSGRSARIALPPDWQPTALPPRPPGIPEMGSIVRYDTKNGSNDSVMLSVITVPDDRFADPVEFKAFTEKLLQRYARDSVEGKVDLKDFKVAGKSGYLCLLTDPNLVGKPTIKDDYKTSTACTVYLGDRLLLNATIFSDDPAGPAYAAAKKLVQSLTITLAQKPI
jgi:hypothetical protein